MKMQRSSRLYILCYRLAILLVATIFNAYNLKITQLLSLHYHGLLVSIMSIIELEDFQNNGCLVSDCISDLKKFLPCIHANMCVLHTHAWHCGSAQQTSSPHRKILYEILRLMKKILDKCIETTAILYAYANEVIFRQVKVNKSLIWENHCTYVCMYVCMYAG